jgi:hypothetical protein
MYHLQPQLTPGHLDSLDLIENEATLLRISREISRVLAIDKSIFRGAHLIEGQLLNLPVNLSGWRHRIQSMRPIGGQGKRDLCDGWGVRG